MTIDSDFPIPILRNGRNFFARHKFENFKRRVAGLPLIDESTVAVVELVPTTQAADELGISQRAMARLMSEARKLNSSAA